MTTLKDVAKLAGVSVTTVSIVINGKAKERNITEETSEKVLKAVKELNYQPNLSARKLRSADKFQPVIALYWPLDHRTHILADILIGIQKEINRINYKCELIIEAYKSNHLAEYAKGIEQNNHNAIIVGGASKNDVNFLNSLNPQIPVALINRESEKFSTISTDTKEIGVKAAKLFDQAGFKNVAVLSTKEKYLATESRTSSFLNACQKLNINVDKSNILKGKNSIEGGVFAAKKYCDLKYKPEAIFCETDYLALGALYTLKKNNIKVPEDVKLLTISLLNEETTKYSIPSLSVISLPNAKIAQSTISTIIDALENNNLKPIHKKIAYNIIFRESFKL